MNSGFLLFKAVHFRSNHTNPKGEIRCTVRYKNIVHRISIKALENQVVQLVNILIFLRHKLILKLLFGALWQT